MKRRTRVGVSVTVNGQRRELEMSASATLVELLRSSLLLTGTKVGCEVGECGACTVLLDGAPVLACLVLAAEVDGHDVTTIESTDDARIDALQRAFVEEAGLQCGFCTPGMILTARSISPRAGDDEIRAALAGNLCRCTGYTKIIDAIRRAAREGKRATRR